MALEALSVDSAVAALEASEAPEPVAAAPDPAPAAEIVETPAEGEEIPATPEAVEDPDAPEEASEEGEEAQPDPDLPAIEPPRSWDADAQAKFKELPRELQEVVLERESDRDRAVSKALQEAKEAVRVEREADSAKIEKLANELTTFLPEALKSFESKWGEAPDWPAVLEQYGIEEYTKLKLQFDADRVKIGEIARKETEARQLVHANFVKTELEKLPTVDPILGDPVKGPELRTEVARYALKMGYATEADLPNVSALQLSMARKAMAWDALPDTIKTGKLDLKTLAPAKPAAPAARPAVRPTAAAPAPSATRVTQQAQGRFAQTRSIDDAVALLEARKR